MEDTNSLIEQRKAKLIALRAKGIDPFQNKFTPTETCDDARANYIEGREVALAGRITAHRDMGKSMFIDIRDQSGRIQAYAQKNTLGDEQFAIFQHLDLGDFIGVNGTLFTTKTGEISVKIGGVAVAPMIVGQASSLSGQETHRQDACATKPPFVILAKALRPPPAKWHGLEDTEIRYRQRYLDLIGNPEVKEVFLKRSAIVHEIRSFFHSRGYVEVETPAMQAIPGGAAAQPFKTFHNALGCEFYLRIALELYHKRLLVGGIDKLFEIGKNFRNEGLSRRHNPEFTMLEAYCAFGDYATMMETVESLITTVAQKVNGSLFVNLPKDKAELDDALTHAISTIITLKKEFSSFESLCDLFAEKLFEIRESRIQLGVKSVSKTSVPIIVDFQRQIANTEMAKATHLTDLLQQQRQRLEALFDAIEIDLHRPWKRVKYKDLIRETVFQDWFEISADERFCRLIALGEIPELLDAQNLQELAALFQKHARQIKKRAGEELEKFSKQILTVGKPEDFEVTNDVFGKFIEPKLLQPTFVTHLPKELVPLAKLSPDDPTTVEVFECCINGQEISPGYTEQNDPIAQRTTLEHQAGGERQKLDEDFLVALEHGMPPAGGIGIGIDRLCMMLLGQESIRDVILFPQLKPK
jgi:lysyl-tRNA synthetase class II